MATRRRIDPLAGQAALVQWHSGGTDTARSELATAVRFSLEEFAHRHPGRSVEVRVPPLGVTQCIAGPSHTRGTPPNVVETDPHTWLRLATGMADFPAEVRAGFVHATGVRADLSEYLPFLQAEPTSVSTL